MARQQFGRTWWGAQWLNSLKEIDWDNRLPRGRRYANNGSVESVTVKGGTVQARVQGSRPTPYRVTIHVPALKKADATRLVDGIAADPALIGRLLNRELDPAVLEHADALGVRVFPSRWQDLDMHCSCPDWAVPCKHLAAVIYTLSREIDGNPFLVFLLRGVDLTAALAQRGIAVAAETEAAPPGLDQLLLMAPGAGDEQPEPDPDPERLAHIDYSGLPYLLDALIRALPADPAFASERDVCKLWATQMRRVAREAGRVLERQNVNGEQADGSEPRLRSGDHPAVLIDPSGDASVTGVEGCHELGDLLAALETLQPDDLPDLQPAVAGLHAVRLGALHLLAAGAAIPRVFALPGGGDGLLWLPATLDASVRTLMEQLARALPAGLLCLKRGRQRLRLAPQAQARVACALVMDHCIREWSDAAAKSGSDKVAELFFGGGCAWFDGPGEGAVAASICVWLSRLHLAEREYTSVLRLEEGAEDAFVLSVEVEPRSGQSAALVPLAVVLRDAGWGQARNGILQTVSLLAESWPAIGGYISAGAVDPIVVPSGELPELLFEVFPVLRLLGIRVLLPRALERLLRPRRSLELSGQAQDTGGFLSADDLFGFNWRVAVGDHLLTPDEFEALVTDATGVVRFRGEYVFLDPDEVERLRSQLGQSPRVSGAERTRVALAGEYEGAPIRLDASARELVKKLTDTAEVSAPTGLQAALRPYQERGFQWLYRNVRAGFGSIIADDMGLGKTLQVIATVFKLKDEGELEQGKALVVVPTTLLTNWCNEVERFAPQLSLGVYHGPGRALDRTERPDLLLTTYGVVRSDAAALGRLRWRLVVVDEAQNIKNPAAAQTKAVKAVRASAHIAMSGTPVENRLSEYWSIMDFANRGYLGTAKRFTQEFGIPIQMHGDQRAAERFRRVTAPFLLRRLKSDRRIISDLPDKIEQDQFCELTPAQTAVYESVVREGLRVIQGESDTFQRQGLVLQMILALKQICNHPAQYLKQGETAADQSGKAQRFLELLDETHRLHEKVLVFTQFREMGELLCRWIAERFGHTPQFLHGGVARKRRDAMVERFQADRTERVFILSLKAGGTGLNLTAASQVIHYDLWWNPAVEAQATDRAYRIGQVRTVQVHRLITRATFEERINAMIRSKRALSELTVGTGEQWIGNLDDRELRELFTLGGAGM